MASILSEEAKLNHFGVYPRPLFVTCHKDLAPKRYLLKHMIERPVSCSSWCKQMTTIAYGQGFRQLNSNTADPYSAASRCPRSLSAASHSSFSIPSVPPFPFLVLLVFFGGMRFQFPIYGFQITIRQAYSQNPLCASAKVFQGENAVRRSCQRPRNSKERGHPYPSPVSSIVGRTTGQQKGQTLVL